MDNVLNTYEVRGKAEYLGEDVSRLVCLLLSECVSTEAKWKFARNPKKAKEIKNEISDLN